MKILIVEKVSLKNYTYKFLEKSMLKFFSILPDLFPRQIAAITPLEHVVSLVNERYQKVKIDDSYDLVNINFTTSTSARAYEIADKFREKNVKVILSGLHASALPYEAKKHADAVLIGKKESIWLNILKDFKKNNLKSFYYPEKHQKRESYISSSKSKLPSSVKTGAVKATRGCPYNCSFCPEANIPSGNDFYSRPVNQVVSEIRDMPQKIFMFYDNSLTIDKEYTKNLFKKMKKLNLGKKFFCNGNVDVLAEDKELVRLSKEAGCVSWLIGFESISQKTLESVGKITNKVEKYSQAVENIHKNKMAVVGDFMFGFDTDTKEVFEKTLKAVKKLRLDVADFSILTPFPGTPLFEKLENEGRIFTKDWSNYTLNNVVFQPKHMSPNELEEGVKKMYKEFYSVRYTVKRIIRSIPLGFFPSLLVISRNAIANLGSKNL